MAAIEPAVQLRPMAQADVEAVLAIEQASYEFPWTRGIFQDCLRVGYCCWLLEHAGRVLAYGVMSVAAGESHVLNLCVAPQCRRAGYARQMLEHLADLAVRHGADTMLLEVRPSNVAAIRLYEDSGFNEVGLRRNYYPSARGREDAMIMARALRLPGGGATA